ncbi:MAG: endonuclease/exonuclease/phosphatase family protein, partial [Gammaproteobacteria bacterium]|nr:endonuclease/exonuclease/phosphatase family protein [Gammaproteobacteria bacterium]
GNIARHSNGLLSRISPNEVTGHKLPGWVPGRGALITHFGDPAHPLVVVLLHLALGKRARIQQLEYVSEVIKNFEHVVVMGDLNCQPGSHEMEMLLERNNLIEPAAWLNTFPSWKPTRKLDHILVSPSLEVRDMSVLHVDYSDHLPIALELVLPKKVQLAA